MVSHHQLVCREAPGVGGEGDVREGCLGPELPAEGQQVAAVLPPPVQYSTVQYSTVQCSAVQYSTVQYSTVQYSIVQYSTILCNVILL